MRIESKRCSDTPTTYNIYYIYSLDPKDPIHFLDFCYQLARYLRKFALLTLIMADTEPKSSFHECEMCDESHTGYCQKFCTTPFFDCTPCENVYARRIQRRSDENEQQFNFRRLQMFAEHIKPDFKNYTAPDEPPVKVEQIDSGSPGSGTPESGKPEFETQESSSKTPGNGMPESHVPDTPVDVQDAGDEQTKSEDFEPPVSFEADITERPDPLVPEHDENRWIKKKSRVYVPRT